jgi:hypothetical protein
VGATRVGDTYGSREKVLSTYRLDRNRKEIGKLPRVDTTTTEPQTRAPEDRKHTLFPHHDGLYGTVPIQGGRWVSVCESENANKTVEFPQMCLDADSMLCRMCALERCWNILSKNLGRASS